MANKRVSFHSRRRVEHQLLYFLFLEPCFAHLLCRPMPRASCRSTFEGYSAHVCSLFNAKRKKTGSVAALICPYRVIDRYAERMQFLIKSWVYGRGLKVFIYVYLPLHILWVALSCEIKVYVDVAANSRQRLLTSTEGFAARFRYQFTRASRFRVVHRAMRFLNFFIFHLNQLLTASNTL